MKLFRHHEHEAAINHAEDGGQALHLWYPVTGGQIRHEDNWTIMEWGRLIDHDIERLLSTAQALGIIFFAVLNRGMRGQHIELCGSPLRKAKDLCLE